MSFHFAQDTWNSKFTTSDKWYHFFGSALLYAVIWFALHLIFDVSILPCMLWAFAGGVLVEIIDGWKADGFSWKDLAMDGLGILAMAFWIQLTTTIAKSLNILTLCLLDDLVVLALQIVK